MMRLDGETLDGRRVSIEGPPTLPKQVWVDGELATVEDVSTMRDGGTTVIATDRGRITLARRIGQEHEDYLDGERLGPFAPPRS